MFAATIIKQKRLCAAVVFCWTLLFAPVCAAGDEFLGIDWNTVAPAELRALIEKEFAADAPDDEGVYPLMYAARWSDKPEVLDVLVEAGARVRARVEKEDSDFYNLSAILFAVHNERATAKMAAGVIFSAFFLSQIILPLVAA
jgi:hypothetical protein